MNARNSTDNSLISKEPTAVRDGSITPLVVDVVGGGPTGLTFALALLSYLGSAARVRIFEPRWRLDESVKWREIEDGNRRRQQVVTLQSNVWAALPATIQQALFATGEYSEMWPYGPDSPESRGRPRNLPIRDIEDRLLELLQTSHLVELRAERYEPGTSSPSHVVGICDGANSPTREYFIKEFGQPLAELYRFRGQPLEETVLGMQIDGLVPDGEGVLITAAQNRYLLNTRGGRGFLNMRLTREEAAELVGLGDVCPVDCLQSRPCVMLRHDGSYRCPTHGALFKPSVDSTSFLWPRIKDGLRLFGLDEDSLVAITAFRFSLVHRPRFVAELARGTWGCLLGDAANAVHFWPGRGLNTGIKSALGLARCLARRWHGASLRASDLCEFQGFMHMLQAREIDNRAWRTMLMCDEHGEPRPIQERITRGLRGPHNRLALIQQLLDRLRAIRARLEGRMGPLPTEQLLEGRLAALSDRTLKVLVESGPWVAFEVGGPEVDVDTVLPLP